MNRLLILLATIALAPRALAQQADPHAGHVMPSQPAADPHAGHDMSKMEKDPPVGPTMPQAEDPHARHVMPQAADPHAGHKMPSSDITIGNAPPPIPTDHAADAVYGTGPMAMSRHHLAEHHGNTKFGKVMVDTAEVQFRDGKETFAWGAEAWYGGDINRIWLKSEGEVEFGGTVEQAEVQALYSHAIGPYFNLQGGVRHDIRPVPSRTYAVLGVEGLAPNFFETEAMLFLSNKGDVSARISGNYDQRITQRLILQPSVELNFALQDVPEIGVGSGLSDVGLALRLRYDIIREFSPYIGVQYHRSFGDTRRFLRDEGEAAGGWSLLTGVRIWF